MNWHEVAEGVMIIFGKLSSKLLFSKLNDCGEFDVNITAKPFARVQEDVPITVDKPQSFNLLNNSLEESFPKIIITP